MRKSVFKKVSLYSNPSFSSFSTFKNEKNIKYSLFRKVVKN